MSLLNAYNQILNEGKDNHEVKSAIKQGQPFASGFKVNKQEGPKVTSPKEDKEHSVDAVTAGKPTKAKEYKESTNPFDSLYKKVLAQENWEAEEEADDQPGAELNFSGDQGTGEGEVNLNDDDSYADSEDESEDPMRQVLTALKAAVEALEKVVGGEEEEEEFEEEEEGGEEEEEEEEEGGEEQENPFGESTEETDEDETDEDEMSEEPIEDDCDAEILGHALIDIEKLAASLSSPKSQVVKGAVPVTKGKAQLPAKGSKPDGKLTPVKGRGENLEGKKNDTGYVKKDKNWYAQ
jgi:hypothetical protein